MIKFNNISKSYGNNKVLDDVVIELVPANINSFLGPNGSGKTTLIKIFLGLVNPNNGEVLYEGKNILKDFKFKENIGYMTQIANFPENLTANDLLNLITKIRKNNPVFKDELINLFELEDSLEKKLKNLSGGTKQKVNVVVSLMFDSPIIVLDEPTVGLDPQSVYILKKFIQKEKERGKTIIMTSHIIQDVDELSDVLNILIEGKVVYSGNKAELLTVSNSTNLEEAVINIYTKRVKC